MCAENSEMEIELKLLLREREISKLLITFARVLDEKDFDAYEDLYMPEGELVTPWGAQKGRAGIRKKVESDLGKYAATQHVSANHDIEIDGDKAMVRSSLWATHSHDAQGLNFWAGGGHYEYELEHTQAGWKIARVEIFPSWTFASDQRDEK